jgi:signal peptidase I
LQAQLDPTESFLEQNTEVGMKEMRKMTAGYILILIGLSLAATVRAASSEYMDFTMRGSGMEPTIYDGDTVVIKICTDVSLIRTGPQTAANPGDIIVYCAAAVIPEPQSMFTCGRAINKYCKDGSWYFKTKLDNNTEPDSWEVPAYALLGVVVEIRHAGNTPSPSSTSEANSPTDQAASDPVTDFGSANILAFTADFTMGMVLGLLLGLAMRNRRGKRDFFGSCPPTFGFIEKAPEVHTDHERDRILLQQPQFLAFYLRASERN